MKKISVLFAILMVLVLFPASEVRAQYYAIFPYFAEGDGWWTGLAVTTNSPEVLNEFSIYITDSDGHDVGWGEFSLTHIYAQKVGLLSSFIGSGSIPARGSIGIYASRSFFATKFTGNFTTGGFSEVQLKAETTAP
jgi:hypothetical protein